MTPAEFAAIRGELGLSQLARLTVTATAPDGSSKSFETLCRIDTPVELDYYRLGAP